jgi:hypothetical protein
MSDLFVRIFAQFDSYSRTARLSPVLLLLLGPVAVGIGVGVPQWPGASSLTAAVVIMGLPTALSDWVRRCGQQLQDRLWAKWGGNPVVISLSEEGLVARRRRKVLADATGLPVNDPSDPEFEEAIANAVRRLITATRDTSTYSLVFKENKAYGFARNLFAIRYVGVCSSSIVLIVGIVCVIASAKISELSTLGTILGTVVASISLLIWLFYPSEQLVWAAANDYKDRLLEALDAGALTSNSFKST